MKSWVEFREAINAEIAKRREKGQPGGTHYGLSQLTGLSVNTIDHALKHGDTTQWGTAWAILDGLGLSFNWVAKNMRPVKV